MTDSSQKRGHSFSVEESFTCPSCGRDFEADLWLIVDTAQRPDLVERIRAEQLHEVSCANCGQTGQLDVPLLVYRPDAEPPLLFSPASETSGEQDHEDGAQLVGALRQSLGEAWRDDWLAQGLHGLSRDALPALLSDDPEAALAELQQRAAAEFERLRQQDPERFRQLQEQAAQEALSRASPPQRNLVQFLDAETWADSQRIVVQNPELLGDEADEMLGRSVEAARGQGDDRAAGHFQEHRDLLRRCRESRVARAFAEKMQPPEALARAEAEGLAPEELLEMQQAAAMQKAGGGPDVPAEFRADVHQAKEAVQRYVSRGDAAGLDAAAAAWERIVEHPGFVGSDARFQLGVLNDAGTVFLRRYWARGRLDDLNRGLALSRQAVQRTPPDSPDLPMYLCNLGNGLRDRYACMGRREDVEEAIRAYQQAVQRTPPDSPDLPSRLNNLGNGLRDRYARTGRLEDLEKAIRLYQQAVCCTPPDSPGLPMYLNNLGNVNSDRYACTGRLEDLEEAMRVYQQAVQRTPPDSPNLPSRLTNLGNGFCDGYARTGRLKDLEEAIRAYQQAVQRTPPDSPNLPASLNNLGTGLHSRYRHTGHLEDLEEAIRVSQQAVQRAPPDSLALPATLNNLGNSLRDRYARTARLEDLEEAIKVYREAVQCMPPDSPGLPTYLNNLGNGLRDRYVLTGRRVDMEEGRGAYNRACEAGALVAPACVTVSGRGWGAWASERSDWREAATAYDHAFRAMDRLLRVQLLRSGWEAWLRETQGLGGRAAYALARDGRLEDAVVALERGRVRLLSESLEQNRRDLERLPELGHSELLERYRQTVGRIQSLQQRAGEAGGLQATLRQSLENAREELDAAIEAIRQVGGYEDFLVSPSFEKIRRAVTAAAPLVYLVTAPQGSLALIVAESVDVLWLDGFREEDLDHLLLEEADDEVTGGYLPGQLGRSDWLKASLEKVLPLLAEKLMGPVAERLRGAYRTVQDGGSRNGNAPSLVSDGGATTTLSPVPPLTPALSPEYRGEGVNTRPQVVLIPTGRLSLLPLHATILHEFTVSYAASAMALAVARDTARTRSGGARRLAGVGNPLPGAERLTELRDALRTVLTAVPETAELAQPRADLARLLDFPVDELTHEGRSLIPLAVQIYAAAGEPAEELLEVAQQWPVSLPHARAELESIADLLPDGHSRTLYEHEAGRQPLLDALAGANLVHLSCHGQFQPDDPLDSGLLLADGQLTLREIMAPGFTALDSARLAVLSACQTAIADFGNLPDEAIGLPAGLTQAGVPSVVGTLWCVNDASTALLMVRFYEFLLQDKLAPPEALCRAQCWLRDATNADLDAYLTQHEAVALARQQEAERMPLMAVHTLLGPVLKGDPNERPYAHPYYWAPFVFYGAEQRIFRTPESTVSNATP